MCAHPECLELLVNKRASGAECAFDASWWQAVSSIIEQQVSNSEKVGVNKIKYPCVSRREGYKDAQDACCNSVMALAEDNQQGARHQKTLHDAPSIFSKPSHSYAGKS
eukprot:1092590-Amphidinium_carterae.1